MDCLVINLITVLVIRMKMDLFILEVLTALSFLILKHLLKNKDFPPVVITDFMLFNKEVSVDDENTPLKKKYYFFLTVLPFKQIRILFLFVLLL